MERSMYSEQIFTNICKVDIFTKKLKSITYTKAFRDKKKRLFLTYLIEKLFVIFLCVTTIPSTDQAILSSIIDFFKSIDQFSDYFFICIHLIF